MIKRTTLKSRLILGLALLCLIAAGPGCKGSKKAADEAKRKAEMEARARELEEKRKNEEAERLRKEEEERNRRAAEEKESKERALREQYSKVENYFQKIATAPDINAANTSINEALAMFSSPEAPLLIIIKKTGDVVDYDRPSSVKKYLEFLKDQKKNQNSVDQLQFDDNGKIKEITLIKK